MSKNNNMNKVEKINSNDLRQKIAEGITIGSSPGWSAYANTANFEKDKEQFLNDLFRLFPIKIVKKLYYAFRSKRLTLDSGDVRVALIGCTGVKIKECNLSSFDFEIEGNSLIAIFEQPVNKFNLGKIQNLVEGCKIRNVLYSSIKAKKEKVTLIILSEN